MTGSLRKLMVRSALRTLIKPMAQPFVPLSVQRTLLDNAGFTMKKPRGLAVATIALAGIPARKLTPENATGDRHVLYLHGGAYVEGSPKSHTALAGQVAHAAGATTWLIDYRLAPEHPHPAAVEDALAAYRALLDAGVAPNRVAIAGDFAGGGLTLAVTLAIRAEQLPLPAALALLSPWTDLTLSGASMLDKLDVEPMLNPPWLDWAAGLYCGSAQDGPATLRTDPGVSPLFADFTGFPPMIVHVGSDEVLLDDATFLGKRAAHAGVEVSLKVYDGLWHVFQAQAGLIAEADASLREIGEFLQRHTGG